MASLELPAVDGILRERDYGDVVLRLDDGVFIGQVCSYQYAKNCLDCCTKLQSISRMELCTYRDLSVPRRHLKRECP